MKITSAKFVSAGELRQAIVTFDNDSRIFALALPSDKKPLDSILRLLRAERFGRLQMIAAKLDVGENNKRVAELDRLIPLLETEQFFLG